MNLSEMRAYLKERDIWLTKSLGQNFLHDGNQIERILRLAEATPGDRVLEIGPGLGALTFALVELPLAAGLIIEKDARLFEALTSGPLGRADGVEWAHDDAMKWLKRNPRDWSGWKLISNLPYSVGSPILVDLSLARSGPDLMVVTLQREVIQRLRAPCGSEEYGALTALVGLNYRAERWFKAPRACFFPEPDVDSACLALRRRSGEALSAEAQERYRQIVKLAFGQRRKTALKTLSAQWPMARLVAEFERLGIDQKTRPERLEIDVFRDLALALGSNR